MPIVYLPAGPPPPRPPTPVTEDAGGPPVLTWTGANGDTLRLTDDQAGYVLMPGVRGLELPEYTHFTRESGALDGQVTTGSRALAREIFLPVHVHGQDRTEALDRRGALALAMQPTPYTGGGTGVLELSERDGTRRRIRARYQDGMGGDEGRDQAGNYWCTYGLTLLADDPYWEMDPVRRTWRIEGTTDLWLPVPPLRVRASEVIGEGMRMANPGTAHAWPVWTITGPVGAGALMANESTGEELEFTRELTDGEAVTIDTRPRRKSVRDQDGTNWFRHLKRGSRLWALAPGTNTVDVMLTGAEEGATLQLEYTPLDVTAVRGPRG